MVSRIDAAAKFRPRRLWHPQNCHYLGRIEYDIQIRRGYQKGETCPSQIMLPVLQWAILMI